MPADNDLEIELRAKLPYHKVNVYMQADPLPPYRVIIAKDGTKLFDEFYSAPEAYTVLYDFNKKVLK